jgi:hypothetical protein
VITDYDQLPILLVEIEDVDALDRLAAAPGVTSISADGSNAPASAPSSR